MMRKKKKKKRKKTDLAVVDEVLAKGHVVSDLGNCRAKAFVAVDGMS